MSTPATPATPASAKCPEEVFKAVVEALRQHISGKLQDAFSDAVSLSAEQCQGYIAAFGRYVAEQASATKRPTLDGLIRAVFPLLPAEYKKDAKTYWASTDAGAKAINALMLQLFEGIALKMSGKSRFYAIPEGKEVPQRTLDNGKKTDWTMQTIISFAWKGLKADVKKAIEDAYAKSRDAYTEALKKWKSDPKNRATYIAIKKRLAEWERTHLGAPKGPKDAVALYMADRKDDDQPVPRAKDAKQKLFDALDKDTRKAYKVRALVSLRTCIEAMQEHLEVHPDFVAIPQWYRQHLGGAPPDEVLATATAEESKSSTGEDEEEAPAPARRSATKSATRASARASARASLDDVEEDAPAPVKASPGRKVVVSTELSDDEEPTAVAVPSDDE